MKVILIVYTLFVFLIVEVLTFLEYESLLNDGVPFCELPIGDDIGSDSMFYILPIPFFLPFFFFKRNKITYVCFLIVFLYYIWRVYLRFLFC